MHMLNPHGSKTGIGNPATACPPQVGWRLVLCPRRKNPMRPEKPVQRLTPGRPGRTEAPAAGLSGAKNPMRPEKRARAARNRMPSAGDASHRLCSVVKRPHTP